MILNKVSIERMPSLAVSTKPAILLLALAQLFFRIRGLETLLPQFLIDSRLILVGDRELAVLFFQFDDALLEFRIVTLTDGPLAKPYNPVPLLFPILRFFRVLLHKYVRVLLRKASLVGGKTGVFHLPRVFFSDTDKELE
jgi:hypothetical protein